MCSVVMLQFPIDRMPLTRTRSLTTNMNGASSSPNDTYLAHIPENTNHLPPLVTNRRQIEDASAGACVPTPPNYSVTQSNSGNKTLPSVSAGSLEACASPANNGSARPRTMVASPEQVMNLYISHLTPYEHHEIFNYPQIYFIGANAKKRPGILGTANNCGYDNDQGSYTHVPHDHVAYRYEVLKIIGKGSFGQVVKVYDHKNHEHVALKMVRNEKRFHRQAQEEIRILEHLRKQDKQNTMNIIHIFDSFTFRNHMCITFELLSINLYELIKKNKFQGFSLQLVRKFSHSLLQCLDALYKNKIIHCDMKPENVLLKQQGRSGIKYNESLMLHPNLQLDNFATKCI
ncbi:dual specificity tyrosine-phosphorylation-regulated kinase 2 isoform X2 [Bacillus rossius redtenbacheri]|uniref:dual specificity tyrosine-phosphorylation-regulated kinase 2 isoform X2 n=1 Tax=Bacillus rossius redtenbacheri TaxID=93214 RepID=UPI002FDDC421